MERIAVLLCAGHAARMGFNKLTTPLAGRTAIERSLRALIAGGAEKAALVVSGDTLSVAREAAERVCSDFVPYALVTGGETRGASVRAGLTAAEKLALDPEAAVVAIHDAARCLVSAETVTACYLSGEEKGSGIAAVPVTDTVFRVDGDGVTPVPRENLWRMQTPQTFLLAPILAAYREGTLQATDDASLWLAAGRTPVFVPASEDNFKLTTQGDWLRAERMLTRFGTGFDTHRLVEGRPLILWGVEIPFEKGLLGHSDADVLVHAVMDALLGAAALPDIGRLFPDTDSAYLGADSMELLKKVVALLREKGLRPGQLDGTVIAQRPKLAPYIPLMRARLAEVCGIPVEAVGLKATTTEGMNDEGRGLCISAQAVATVL